MNKLIIILLSVFLIGCTSGEDYDGLIVKDADGNIYKIVHNIGDSYFIRYIDAEPILKLSKDETDK